MKVFKVSALFACVFVLLIGCENSIKSIAPIDINGQKAASTAPRPI
ncbi:hypothetical protein IJG44_08755 [bacterium]|nr:hypothetical protein [bacterium]